jgi:hypothetical protein
MAYKQSINNKNIMKRKMNNRQSDRLQISKSKSEKAAAQASQCVTAILKASEIKSRQCVYISRETHEKVAVVVNRLGNGLSIGKFVDNILIDHFRRYGVQYTEQIENLKKVML